MKKRILALCLAISMSVGVSGCGNDQKATDSTDIETDSSKDSEDILAYEDPDSLPVYAYTGTEEYLDVISEYLIDKSQSTQADDTADVLIPFSIVAETDDSNPDDIVVYGSYNIDGYELMNTTLVAGYGSRGNGAFHIRKNTDGSYEVVNAQLPEVEEEEAEVFAPVDGLYERIVALTDDERMQARAEAIAGYVNTNGLNITQWQDYGWAPVSVLNAPPTPEEAQFYTYHSNLGYEVTYDLRELSLSRSDEEDMFGKVEENDTGTLMVAEKADSINSDEVLLAAAGLDADDIDISDAIIGDDIACRRAEWNEDLEDGRIFRYICYAVPLKEDILTIKLETTYEKGVSEMSLEDLEREFSSVLSTFAM